MTEPDAPREDGRDSRPDLRAGVDGGATIMVSPDGPLIVRGAVVLGADGEPLPDQRPTMALCRCGRSADKPFCDSTHKKIGFKAP